MRGRCERGGREGGWERRDGVGWVKALGCGSCLLSSSAGA